LNTIKIAEELNVCHYTVMKTIFRYKIDFDSLDKNFELKIIREKPSKNSKGGKPKNFYILNYWQKCLLILYLQNNKIIKEKKFEILRKIVPTYNIKTNNVK